MKKDSFRDNKKKEALHCQILVAIHANLISKEITNFELCWIILSGYACVRVTVVIF